jgi:antitoxin HigA-1
MQLSRCKTCFRFPEAGLKHSKVTV